jgi:hypothetical protein
MFMSVSTLIHDQPEKAKSVAHDNGDLSRHAQDLLKEASKADTGSRIVGNTQPEHLDIPPLPGANTAHDGVQSAPPYEPEKWNKDTKIANCYLYAANNFDPKYSSYETEEDPGADPKHGNSSIDKVNIYSTDPGELKKFTDAIVQGAEHDGMTWTGKNANAAPDHYKAALFIRPATGGPDDGDVMDYHFIRRDSNGAWSQKEGAEGPVTNRDNSGNPITNPEKANMGEYKFAGYFDVPKGGIDLKRNESSLAGP